MRLFPERRPGPSLARRERSREVTSTCHDWPLRRLATRPLGDEPCFVFFWKKSTGPLEAGHVMQRGHIKMRISDRRLAPHGCWHVNGSVLASKC